LVKVRFDETDERVLPDMSAKIAFLSRKLQPVERKPVPAVRPEAIVKREGKDVAYIVTGVTAAAETPAVDAKGETKAAPASTGKVEITPVTVGGTLGDLVRVEGLAPGTRVVINPPPKLASGATVAAARK
jgi:hypothetical protein